MKPIFLFGLGAALVSTLCGAEPAAKDNETRPTTPPRDQSQAEARNPEGEWKPIAAVMGGVRLPKPELDAITLKITGDEYEVTAGGEEHSDYGTFTLDTNTVPKQMTIKSTRGANAGKTFLAIYEMMDAGSMRVCYDLSGTAFPKKFAAPKGTSLYLVGYRRQKK